MGRKTALKKRRELEQMMVSVNENMKNDRRPLKEIKDTVFDLTVSQATTNEILDGFLIAQRANANVLTQIEKLRLSDGEKIKQYFGEANAAAGINATRFLYVEQEIKKQRRAFQKTKQFVMNLFIAEMTLIIILIIWIVTMVW